MTVTVETPVTFDEGDGVSTSFLLGFTYGAVGDVAVSVMLNGSPLAMAYAIIGGSCVFDAAPPAGAKITMMRTTPVEQDAGFPSSGAFPSASFEKQLDRLTRVAQEQVVARAAAVAAAPGQTAPGLDISGLIDGDLLQMRGGVLSRVAREVFAGKFYGGDASGALTPLSGTGADAALRVDLAQGTGVNLVGGAANSTLGNVEAIKRQLAGTTFLTQLAGTTYPFQDLVGDQEPFGTVLAPLVPISAYPTSFTTLKNAYAYIGAGHVGGVQLAIDYLQVRGAPAVSSENQNYVSRQFFTSVTANMGGTALTMADSKGQFFGFGSLAVAYPGATNLRNLTAAEINVQASAGATVAYKSGLQVVGMPDDKAQGTVYDAAISLSNQAGAVGFGVGLLVSSNANGQQSVSTGGTLIAALDFPSCATGLNFNGVTFSQNAFLSNGFAVDGSGGMTVGNIIQPAAGALIRLGASGTASSVGLQFKSSGATAGLYDSAITGFGGGGTQGQGGISVDCSAFQPGQTNYASLGAPSKLWDQVYAATTAINTSDLTRKTVLGKLSDAQFSSVLDAIGEVDLIAFKFNDAIVAKGEAEARKHAGIGAQQVQERFQAHGLDGFEWGVLGTDPDMEDIEEDYQTERQVTEAATREEKQVVIEDGKPVQKVVSVPYDKPVYDRMDVLDESGNPVIIPGLPARTVAATDASGQILLNPDGTFVGREIPATQDAPLTYPVPRMEPVTLKRKVSRQKTDADGKPALIWSVRMHEFWALRMAYEQRERLKLAGSGVTA
ncbi:tail fiber domain-containing protein [Novosphingobium rosa]|uniref:tail fiber domain-containing protein n=1 Tax=Novosphingobium rosa TaxID=76978 RepID=UPI0008377B9F|nr:tail fiber domain-containing protein [Novosphingobium rosa]